MHRNAKWLGLLIGIATSASQALAGGLTPGVYYFSCNYQGAQGATESYGKCFAQARLYWGDRGLQAVETGGGPSINPPNRIEVICDDERVLNDQANAVETSQRFRISAATVDETAIVLPVGPTGDDLLADVKLGDPTVTTSWLDVKSKGQLRGYCEVRRGRLE